MVLTVRVATGLETYVGSGTSTGSQAFGSRGAGATASATAGNDYTTGCGRVLNPSARQEFRAVRRV